MYNVYAKRFMTYLTSTDITILSYRKSRGHGQPNGQWGPAQQNVLSTLTSFSACQTRNRRSKPINTKQTSTIFSNVSCLYKKSSPLLTSRPVLLTSRVLFCFHQERSFAYQKLPFPCIKSSLCSLVRYTIIKRRYICKA